MDDDEYDEFGNPVSLPQAPRVDADAATHGFEAADAYTPYALPAAATPSSHGDAPHFGDAVEVMYETVPADDIRRPLVAPAVPLVTHAPLLLEAKKAAEEQGYLQFLASNPARRRTFAVIGHLHHGKTSLVAGLTDAQHAAARPDEVTRGISVKASVLSAVRRGVQCKSSTLFTVIDTPGHPDFLDEVVASLRLVDAALVCLDVAEGLHEHTKRLVRCAVAERLPVVLVLTKLDRLVLDLRLRPEDAYHKLKALVDTVNNVLGEAGAPALQPQLGQVLFSSEKVGLFFSLSLFARAQYPQYDAEAMARRLWGPVAFRGGKFVPWSTGSAHTFTTFILQPIYKVLTHAIAGKGAALDPALTAPTSGFQGILTAVASIFGDCRATAVDALIGAVPTGDARDAWLCQAYTGCSKLEFCGHVTLVRDNGGRLVAAARILRGTLRKGTNVELFHSSVDSSTATVDSIWVLTASGLVPLDAACSGNVVLLGGELAEKVGKAPLILPLSLQERAPIEYPPLRLPQPLVSVSIDPVATKHQSTFRAALRAINATFPAAVIRTESSGETVVIGFGELYLDVLMHDLRRGRCSGFPLRLSPPFVCFQESVDEESGPLALVPPNAAPNTVQLGVTASRLPREVGQMLERGDVPPPQQGDAGWMREKLGWDLLQVRGYWGQGPSPSTGPNTLHDDTLKGHIPKEWRRSLLEGFRQAVTAGPLCQDPVRDVSFAITMAVDFNSANALSPAMLSTVISTMRTACHEAFLAANPRLMEPILLVEATVASGDPAQQLNAVGAALAARRGSVLKEVRNAGTPLCTLRGLMPLLDSFGFEAEVRSKACGEVHVLMTLDHWAPVPGDPFDPAVQLAPMQAAHGIDLARDFTSKTRSRKGLREADAALLGAPSS